MLRIGLVPAEYGNSIFIRIEDNDITNFLIDGGTKSTFENFLDDRIREIVDHDEKIDLLVCTHIDDDHIKGLIPLVSKYNGNIIKEVWHNGFFQVVDKNYYSGVNQKCLENDTKIIGEIESLSINKDLHDIGINESISFDVCLLENGIPTNVSRMGQAIMHNNTCSNVHFGQAEIIVLGPDKNKISALENKWCEEMLSRNYRFSVTDRVRLMKSFEILMSRVQMMYLGEEKNVSSDKDLIDFCTDFNQVDRSITNASSISFAIKYNDKSFLFLGDSVIDDDFLNRLSLFFGYEYKFEGIQLPHHGSRYNINKQFIKRYTAKEYYILTNSDKFNHPDIITLANVIVHNRDNKKIIFNYPIEKATFLINESWMEKYNYEVIIGDGKSIVERVY